MKRDKRKSNLSIDNGEITATCHLGKPLRVCVVGSSLFLVCSKCNAEVGRIQARILIHNSAMVGRLTVEGVAFSKEGFSPPRWRPQR